MGTSSIYNGKNDRNPLLPDDYEDNQSEDPIQNGPIKWETVKSNMSKFIKSGGSRGSTKHITKQYIKAAGGSKRMASQSTSGIRTGGSLGTLFNGLRTEGYAKTFSNLGIEFVGKSVQEVFSHLIDILAPGSTTKEDIVAKEATKEALSKVYGYVENNNMNLECLDKMSFEIMNEALCEYISSFIWALMMKDLESRFEIYIDDPKQSLSFEQEFKDYISSTVRVEFDTKGDIVNQDVKSSLSELYGRCLEVLEGTI
ncbi:hypothetical protein KIAC18_002651 [Sporomusa sphaeroides]|uniref:hypothetical protein n=1 Tax=Sporomusa sphaeroides TaxID=47679 RepID=UPI003DA075DE